VNREELEGAGKQVGALAGGGPYLSECLTEGAFDGN